MSYAEYAAHSPRPGEIARAAFDAWRSITRAQVKGAFLFGCALSMYHFIVFANGIFTQGARPLLSLSKGFLKAQLGAFILMLVLIATDRITGGDPRRRAAYAAAVVVSATLYAPLLTLISEFGPELAWIEFAKGTLYFFFEWLVLAGIATFIYTDRRRAQAALARMRAAEIERAHTAKRTLESRLQAMQARVEPQFLFNTLAQVRDLYRSSTERGEHMLDELIAYLRAAMPKMRDTSSTVAQELELVRAYLGIVRLRLGERLAFDVEMPDRHADARMPPMMLLPLVDHAITHGLDASDAMGSIRIRTRRAEDKLRLEIDDRGPGFAPETEGETIAGVRERLSALYGDDASLVLRRSGIRATQAILEIRYELAEAVA